jgi:FG-GAP-like repeat
MSRSHRALLWVTAITVVVCLAAPAATVAPLRFSRAKHYRLLRSSPPEAIWIAAGNLTRDRRSDLVVGAGERSPGSPFGALGDTTVLLAKRGGRFSGARRLKGRDGPLALADFNRDRKLDIVRLSSRRRSAILLGNGRGRFTRSLPMREPAFPLEVAVGDFNSDRKRDIAVTGRQDLSAVTSDLWVRLGDGRGGFSSPRRFESGTDQREVAAGDFNRDRRADLAVITYPTCCAGDLRVLLGDGGGGFSPAGTDVVGQSPSSVTVGDFNRDRKPDLTVGNLGGPVRGDLRVLLGDGKGSFSRRRFRVGQNQGQVAIADFNRDRKPDVAIAVEDYVRVLLGNGRGDFPRSRRFRAPGVQGGHMAVGYFNRDRRPDLAAASDGLGGAWVLLNRTRRR